MYKKELDQIKKTSNINRSKTDDLLEGWATSAYMHIHKRRGAHTHTLLDTCASIDRKSRRVSCYYGWFDNELLFQARSGCVRIGRICFGMGPVLESRRMKKRENTEGGWPKWRDEERKGFDIPHKAKEIFEYDGRCKNKSFLFKYPFFISFHSSHSFVVCIIVPYASLMRSLWQSLRTKDRNWVNFKSDRDIYIYIYTF